MQFCCPSQLEYTLFCFRVVAHIIESYADLIYDQVNFIFRWVGITEQGFVEPGFWRM